MTYPGQKGIESGGRIVVAILAGLIIAGSAACGGSGGGGSGSNTPSNIPTDPSPGTDGNRTSSITVVNTSYSPIATTVSRGSIVQWTWNSCDAGYGGDVCTAHTVTFDDGPSSQLQDHGSYSRMFDKAGTYKYHCQIHGASMSGSVTVE
jgi:plastocyanin